MSSTQQAIAPRSVREPESSIPAPPVISFSAQNLYGNEFIQSMLPHAVDQSDESSLLDEEIGFNPIAPEQVVIPAHGNQIGLIIRGKRSLEHEPMAYNTHADVLLSNGMPVGFFGDGVANPGLPQQVGIGLPGRVGTPDWWVTKGGNRGEYVNGELAKAKGLVSTLCTLDVEREQAEAFDRYWEELSTDPGVFSLIGDNCSTHASEAFESAKLIPGGIPGVDTPNGLYEELRRHHGDALKCKSGYIDFHQQDDGTWAYEVSQ